MSLLIVGSVAFDTIETPFGKAERVLGGSATYASFAASYFAKPYIVAVVGRDFGKEYFDIFKKHNIDTSGIKIADGKTFFWQGYYSYDLNTAHTIKTEINVFNEFNPKLEKNLQNIKFVFLGNIGPELQLSVYKQIKKPKIVACDTMNLWIEKKYDELKEVLKVVDILFINEAEIKQLTKEYNIIKAAKVVKKFGCEIIIVKRGEYGAMCFYKDNIFAIPSYPLEKVFDPTGAGDSFAGGVMGFLASKLKNKKILSEKILRQAIIFGTVTASFCVEDFSINKISKITFNEICKRYREIKKITYVDDFKV